MTRSPLVEEFHADHARVVGVLLELRGAVLRRDPAGARLALEAADRLVGPHFKFEELHLYDRLAGFIGDAGVVRLLHEHDGIFRGVANLVRLARLESWDDAQARAAAANLELIWEHPVTCDGLGLYIERLPESVQSGLLEHMLALRREGTTLLEYREERS